MSSRLLTVPPPHGRRGQCATADEDSDSSFVLIADADPLAQVRVPLPAGSRAAGATQARDSYPDSNASAASATGAAATAGAADMSAPAAMSAPGAAAGMGAPGAAAAGATMSAPAAAAMTAPAAAATTGNFYALAKRGVFPIEDLKGRQTDVRDFLLAQNKSPCVVLRRFIRCGCGCRCSARHRQRNPGCTQCQGCLSALSDGISPRLRHGRASPSVFRPMDPAAAFAPCAMNRQGTALVPLGQASEGGWAVLGFRLRALGRAALAAP
jgi:hypothetical protein